MRHGKRLTRGPFFDESSLKVAWRCCRAFLATHQAASRRSSGVCGRPRFMGGASVGPGANRLQQSTRRKSRPPALATTSLWINVR